MDILCIQLTFYCPFCTNNSNTFVPLVEEGMLHDSVTDEVASRYLESMKEENIDSLILGCTHYPLLRSTVGKIMGPEVNLVNLFNVKRHY